MYLLFPLLERRTSYRRISVVESFLPTGKCLSMLYIDLYFRRVVFGSIASCIRIIILLNQKMIGSNRTARSICVLVLLLLVFSL